MALERSPFECPPVHVVPDGGEERKMVAKMRPTRMPRASVPAVGSLRPQPATGFAMVWVDGRGGQRAITLNPGKKSIFISSISRASKETRVGYKSANQGRSNIGMGSITGLLIRPADKAPAWDSDQILRRTTVGRNLHITSYTAIHPNHPFYSPRALHLYTPASIQHLLPLGRCRILRQVLGVRDKLPTLHVRSQNLGYTQTLRQRHISADSGRREGLMRLTSGVW